MYVRIYIELYVALSIGLRKKKKNTIVAPSIESMNPFSKNKFLAPSQPIWLRAIAIPQSVCPSVRLSVCPSAC